MSMLVERAAAFAAWAHGAQKRKYTGEPYWTHSESVARLTMTAEGCTEEMRAAAWLHDTVEDAGVTIADLDRQFGEEVATLVGWVTDVSQPSDGNRAERKAKDLMHLAMAPSAAKTIKLCDVIHNARSVAKYDQEFARVYLPEKMRQVMHLGDGDPDLWKLAHAVVTEKMREVGIPDFL